MESLRRFSLASGKNGDTLRKRYDFLMARTMADLSRIKVEKQTHPDLSILSPFDIASEYSRLPSDEFRGDSHYALQVCIVLHGAAELVFEDYTRIYRSGELWWNMCWEPHAYRFIGKRTFVVAVNLDVEQLGACSPFGGCNWLVPFIAESRLRFCPVSKKDRSFVLETGKTLFHLSRKKENNWKIRSWLMIHDLLLLAIRRMEQSAQQPDDMEKRRESLNSFSRIRYALNKVWSSETRPPSLSEAARMCSLSPSRFSELFRRTMGVSYGRFALRVRMSNAARDLLSGRFALDEIAQKWGFFDSAHFCHSFKNFYRVSPRQFVSRKPPG